MKRLKQRAGYVPPAHFLRTGLLVAPPIIIMVAVLITAILPLVGPLATSGIAAVAIVALLSSYDRVANRHCFARLREQRWPEVRLGPDFVPFSKRAWSRLPSYEEAAVIPWESLLRLPPSVEVWTAAEVLLYTVLTLLDEVADESGDTGPAAAPLA